MTFLNLEIQTDRRTREKYKQNLKIPNTIKSLLKQNS